MKEHRRTIIQIQGHQKSEIDSLLSIQERKPHPSKERKPLGCAKLNSF